MVKWIGTFRQNWFNRKKTRSRKLLTNGKWNSAPSVFHCNAILTIVNYQKHFSSGTVWVGAPGAPYTSHSFQQEYTEKSHQTHAHWVCVYLLNKRRNRGEHHIYLNGSVFSRKTHSSCTLFCCCSTSAALNAWYTQIIREEKVEKREREPKTIALFYAVMYTDTQTFAWSVVGKSVWVNASHREKVLAVNAK